MDSDLNDPARAPARPTSMRHLVVFTATLTSILLYLDRLCVGIAQGYIEEDLHLTRFQLDLFFGGFFFSYALGQVPAGWLSDRFGSRLMMTVYVIGWSLLTALTGLANGFLLLLVFRLGFGVAQAGAYPTSGSLLSKWVPISSRGLASSIVALGGRIGGALAPILTALLIVQFVPLSYPSQFTLKDLRPGRTGQLSDKLVPMDPPRKSVPATDSAAVIWNKLPTDLQTTVRATADKYRAEAAKTKKLVEAEELTEDQRDVQLAAISLPADDQTRLVEVFNGFLEQSTFYDSKAMRYLELAGEGRWLLPRMEDPETPLKPDERQRLHRLIVEATFPAEIGKVYVAGWRPVLLVYGLSGIAVGLLVWIVFRDHPTEHPWCNQAERALINSAPPAAKGQTPPFPWGTILKSLSIWCSSLTQIGTNIGWVLLVTYLPRYLDEVYHVEIVTRGAMTSAPMVAGIIGMIIGGPLTDWAARAYGLKWGRRLPLVITRFLSAAAYVAIPFVNDPWVAVGLFCAVSFFCDSGIASLWAFMQDVGGRYVGALLGWGNMWGNFAAAAAPLLYGWLLTERPTLAHWNFLFYVCAACFVSSGIIGLGIDASQPISEDAPARVSS